MLILVASEKLGLNLNWSGSHSVIAEQSSTGSAAYPRGRSGFADSVLASRWPTMSQKSGDFTETICDVYCRPGRVLLELRSWWCHRQAHESPCSESTQARGQAK